MIGLLYNKQCSKYYAHWSHKLEIHFLCMHSIMMLCQYCQKDADASFSQISLLLLYGITAEAAQSLQVTTNASIKNVTVARIVTKSKR